MNVNFIQKKQVQCLFAIFFIASTSLAASLTTEIHSPKGNLFGKVMFEDTEYGLLIKPKLSQLPEGIHGFHFHQNSDCSGSGMKAGGHFDPTHSNSHQGPYGQGHLGDLPTLIVNSKGEAAITTLAPRLKTKDIQGHSIMIHAGGDNYSDRPELNGGGGARLGCGVIF